MSMVNIYSTDQNLLQGVAVTRIYGNLITALLLLIPLYLTAMEFPDTPALTWFANRAGPVWFITFLAVAAVRVLRTDTRLIWTPIFWIPAQSAIFFGFGPMVLVFGNDITQQKLARHFLSVTDQELIWANQLSTVGVLFLLFGVFLHLYVSRRRWNRAILDQSVRRAPLSPGRVAIAFVAFGFVLKYFIALPAAWGTTEMTIPGFLTSVVKLLDVGLALMAFLAARGNRQMRLLMLLLLPVHVILSGLTFSKNQLITALLFPALGDLMGRRSMRRFSLFVLFIAVIYFLSQDYVHYGRAAIMEETGTISKAGYGERLAISVDYLFSVEASRAHQSSQDDLQGWWTRLNFAGVQVAARDLYLEGSPNESLHGAWMYFIPRIVWPGKPVITGPSWFFYESLTGNTGSHLGLSIYGDLYWMGGWMSLVVGTFLIGWMFAMMSVRSMQFLRDRNFLMFPLILIPVQAAIFGLTNFVVSGIVALIPLYLAYYLLMSVINRFLLSLRKTGRH